MIEALHESTLKLSSEELRWARELKAATIAAAKESDHLKEISDFEYAHYALYTRGDVEQALERIEMMQHFREEYKINDTPEEGMEILLRFTREQQPWFMVSIDYSSTQGHFIYVYDYARLNPGVVKYPEDWRIFLGGMYYIYQLSQCNFMACREGIVHICECDSMSNNNFNGEFMMQNWHHLMAHYPIVQKECSWLHTPLEGNLQHAFYKRLMGPMANIIRVGCHFDGYDGRIDEMFKTPTEAIAEQRLLTRYLCYLRVRYHHQASYRLPLPDPPTGPARALGPAANQQEEPANANNQAA